MNKLFNIFKALLIGVSFIASTLIYFLLENEGLVLCLVCLSLSIAFSALLYVCFKPLQRLLFVTVSFSSATVVFTFISFVLYRFNKDMLIFYNVNLSTAGILLILLISLFIVGVYVLSYILKLILFKLVFRK